MNVLYFVTLFVAVCGSDVVTICNKPFNFQRFFSKFNVQSPAVVVVGGYLPQLNGSWDCSKNTLVTDSDVYGVFFRYVDSGRGVELGVSQSQFSENSYQLYFHKPTNGNPGATAWLRICKYSNKTLGPTYGSMGEISTGKACLINQRVPAFFQDNVGIVIGLTWDSNGLTVFADKIYRFNLPNAWSRAVARCYDPNSCAFQFVKTPSYYVLNVTGPNVSDIQYEMCAGDCTGYANNVFATSSVGHIPDGFSFNNWFLLSNDSTLVQGKVVSLQPLKVNCLWPVPRIQGVQQYFDFNQTVDGVCNGATIQEPPEALRFNVNDTSVLLSEGAIVLHSVSGANLSFECGNSTTPPSTLYTSLLGERVVTLQPFYCFLKTQFSNGTSYNFLAILPNVVREIVITKYGSVYVNGFGYLHIGPLSAVTIDFSSHSTSTDVSGFWTIASTNFAETLIQVNGTNIQRVLYCDDPVSQLKCSQLSFDLQDGFYPMASTTLAQEQPLSFVTLPSFNNHAYLNISVSGFFEKNGGQLTNVSASINNAEQFCVNTRQFTLKTDLYIGPGPPFTYARLESKCPFTLDSLNNYLSFSKFCVSFTSLAASCTIDVYGHYAYGLANGQTFRYESLVTTMYFQHAPGELLTGTPKPLHGLEDVSFLNLDVCTKYTIYGFKGEGIIRETNTSYLSGIYYTSEAGQLLAFKNVTSGVVYSVTPCSFSQQAAFIDGDIVGVISSLSNSTFNATRELPGFYYHSNDADNCTDPVLVYSNIGVCRSGSIGYVPPRENQPKLAPMVTGNISIPTNFTMSIRTEYLQLYNAPVSVDCAMYVCNGNERCKQLLTQYTSACNAIQTSLQLSARLESFEVNSMLTVSDEALNLATIDKFNGGDYNFTSVLGATYNSRSAIEDLLFDKVVTNGLGTVDEDYKRCSNGLSIADLACAQYYSGVMVLPGVVDAEKLHMYSASLVGGMALGGITSAAALPFSYAVQARLNYLALQTDVLQRNQQILAESFNSAIGNITLAFESVNEAISQTSQGLQTVAQALEKVQGVVNSQGAALSHLTLQLQHNFQAISSSIDDIYARLDQLTADAQVDRIITGRLAALNAFVSQTLTKYTEVQASRRLAQQKVNECVKSQSQRYGFCGDDGEHIFSIVQAAPQGLLFLHTVLVPGAFVNVVAIAGLCVDDTMAMTLREAGLVLFTYEGGDDYYVTSRKMFEPRSPTVSDFVQIESCLVTYVNLTSDLLPDVIPDYIDVNKTLEEILAGLPNRTQPSLPLDVFNATYLNLTGEIADLEMRSEALRNTTDELRHLINSINNTMVNLEWLNRVETYIKWPWWVWLIIVVSLVLVGSLLVFCCISTGCCGCCGCCGACFSSCCRGSRLQPYEHIEKIHVQ
ncbi:spike protein [Alphacoronavirus sp.]|uniref:Spike glycoprotein n=1 Tax=alphacoronavirus sp. WA1087 TaxID=3069910 RepID=A0AA48UFH2_9ALPC|nr:spike protein [Alphacoronavirus sp.]QGX41945.1 spike protein [alphacoronavirus sp. WA1087]